MSSFFMISFLTILASFHPSEAKNATDASILLQTYIVQLSVPDHTPHLLSDEQARESWYASLLSQVVSDADAESSRLVHSYHHVFPGFSARLTQDEFEAMQQMEGVLSAWPDVIEHLHTTHSPQFMGLNVSEGGLWNKSGYGSGITIGVLDSGITAADHVSFKSNGPPPSEWNGKCQAPTKCNKKLVGAKAVDGSSSPTDESGHGSHVAGIAAGYMVANVDVGGEGSGTASGIGAGSQLAIYRVCNPKGCSGAAILAGFDAAIADKVDVISVSIGPKRAQPMYQDTKAIGAFAAMKRGIFVSLSWK